MPREQAAVARFFPWLTKAESSRLERIDASPYPTADGAAILLGHDLWIEPLVAYRRELERTQQMPPPLWQFPWRRAVAWDAHRWRTLSLDARTLRARAGSLIHRVERPLTAQVVQMSVSEFLPALAALIEEGLAAEDRGIVCEPIADSAALEMDLRLVELIAHWLRMLAHGDRVMRESIGTRFDVCGYRGACAQCRALWGVRPRRPAFVPPFHPGCRCFAQPSFAA